MDICHLYNYEHQARIAVREYAQENQEDIERIMLQNSNNRIWTKDGNSHYFMGTARYFQWAKGKIYMLSDGTLMHSGYPI